MKENNQKNNIIIILLTVLIIMGLAGFIVYDKVIKKDGKENNTQINTSNPKSNNKNSSNQNNSKENDEEDKMVQLVDKYNSVFAKYLKLEDVNKIPNQLKLKFLMHQIDEYYNGFTVNTLKEIANRYFDKDFTFTNEDIKDDLGILAKYDSSTEAYEWVASGHDGGDSDMGYSSKSFLVDSNYNEKTKLYEVKVKSYYTYCTDVCMIVDVYGSPNTNDLILSINTEDVNRTEADSKAKVFLDCDKNSKNYNGNICEEDIREMASEIASEYVKEKTYYFTKLENGNYALKKVK